MDYRPLSTPSSVVETDLEPVAAAVGGPGNRDLLEMTGLAADPRRAWHDDPRQIAQWLDDDV